MSGGDGRGVAGWASRLYASRVRGGSPVPPNGMSASRQRLPCFAFSVSIGGGVVVGVSCEASAVGDHDSCGRSARRGPPTISLFVCVRDGGAPGRPTPAGGVQMAAPSTLVHREDPEGGPQIGRFIVTNSIVDRLTRAGEYPHPVPPDGFDTRLRGDTWWSRRLRAAIVKAHGIRPRGWPTPFPRGRPSSTAAGRRAISAHVTWGQRLCWVDRRPSTEGSRPYPLSAAAPTLLIAPRRSAAPGVTGPPPHRGARRQGPPPHRIAESSPRKSAAADGPGGAPHRGGGRPTAAAPRGLCASACQQSGAAAGWVVWGTVHPANSRIGVDGGGRQRKVPATGGRQLLSIGDVVPPYRADNGPETCPPTMSVWGAVQVGAGVEGREPTETLLAHHPFCACSAFCQRARPGCFAAGGSGRSRFVTPQRAVGSAAVGRRRSLSRPRQLLTPRRGGPVARLASSQGGVGWQQRWGQCWDSQTVLSRSWPTVRSRTSFLRGLLAPKPDADGFQRVDAGG